MPARGSTLAAMAGRVGGEVSGDPGVLVTDVTHDSRQAGPGVLFVAVRGARHDGHDFAATAVAAGSPALVVEHLMPVEAPQIVVGDTRASMGAMASLVHGDPSHHLAVVGVTGTNGKTTVTHYIESIANGSGHAAGLVGTIETRIGDSVLPSVRTTPEATDFQRLLAEMRDRGAEVVATEVSSHALEMGRVAGTRFEVAAFTNLSQDHLDFHGNMEAYQRAKESLFREYEIGTAVINVVDPVGEDIAGWYPGRKTLIGPGGDLFARNVHTSLDGTSFELVLEAEVIPVRSPLIGEFNVENALVAAGCCLALGMSPEQVAAGLGDVAAVPGRFELVSVDTAVHVVVDYAHTPDGVRKAVDVARVVGKGRVIAVLGAGGDRDREKRPLMGAAASTADLAVITSDNPRSEDPDEIIDQVASGATGSGEVVLEADRRRAIEIAIGAAAEGDIVLILGKGHETGQEIGAHVHPFDDRLVARELLEHRRESANSGPVSGSMAP